MAGISPFLDGGTGKEGAGSCPGRVAGVLGAAGPERAAARVRKVGREGRMIPKVPGDASVSGG